MRANSASLKLIPAAPPAPPMSIANAPSELKRRTPPPTPVAVTTEVPLKLMSSAIILIAEVVVFALVNVPEPVNVNVPAPVSLLSASTPNNPVPLSTVTPVFTVIPLLPVNCIF